MTQKMKNAALSILNYWKLVQKDSGGKGGKAIAHAIYRSRLVRTGFLQISSILYDFENHDPKNYLSDWARLNHASKINDRRRVVLDDKLIFHQMNLHNPKVKPVIAITKGRKILKLQNHDFIELDKPECFNELVRSYQSGLIIKPFT